LVVLLIVPATERAYALKPNEILVIANGSNTASVRIAEYYCNKRSVPKENILKLALNEPLNDNISRNHYEKLIAQPVSAKLLTPDFSGRIKCLLTVYGVPLKVGPRGMLKNEQKNLTELNELVRRKTDQLKEIIRQLEVLSGVKCAMLKDTEKQPSVKNILKELDFYVEDTSAKVKTIEDELQKQQRLRKWLTLYAGVYGKTKMLQAAKAKANLSLQLNAAGQTETEECIKLFAQAGREKWGFGKRIENGFYKSVEKVAGLSGLLLRLLADIDNIKGTETGASVDSELSMVMFDDYELHRQLPNELKDSILWIGTKTLMVSRLDGPGEHIAMGLVDKAVSAQRNGLKGVAYIDSGYPKKKRPLYEEYDESLRQTALMIEKRDVMKVVQEQTTKLFAPGQCPNTALYCGWYSLKKYVDAFDFVDGAIGCHIASWEAANLRDAQSSQWCPAMLMDGVTATMGAVAEPYLAAFPKPDLFFAELIKGKCLVEAYYRVKPFNSWQMVLIGDPLYRPFK
jgi:uncharacterized protein (TIGR03790 family)